MIRAPAFWWRPRAGLAALALSPVAALWAALAARRMRQPPVLRPDMPVICIGNLVVGGAGKTPTALAVAGLARGLGLRPGFITRGYGGSVRGAHLVDPARDDAALTGDEALLLAAAGPVAVAPDRPAGVPLLAAAGADIAIMDDGFQNPSLAKDFSLVVVDGAVGIGNGRVMPAGPLRAPLAAQMPRADAVLIIGEGAAGDHVVRLAARAGRVVLKATLEPVDGPVTPGRRVLAFAGIGRPGKFFASLSETGFDVVVAEPFPDHHPFGEEEAERLLARAEAEGLALVTTAKDHARLRGATGARQRLAERAEVFAVTLRFEDEARMAGLIGEAVRRRRL